MNSHVIIAGNLITCALMLASNIVATTILGIWTENQITIAADSKQTIYRNHEIVGSQLGCKIVLIRGAYLALAGVAKAESIDVIDAVRNSVVAKDSKGDPVIESSVWIGGQSALETVLERRGRDFDSAVNTGMIIAGGVKGKLQMRKMAFLSGPPPPPLEGGLNGANLRLAQCCIQKCGAITIRIRIAGLKSSAYRARSYGSWVAIQNGRQAAMRRWLGIL